MYDLITTKKHSEQKLGRLPVVNFTSNTYKMFLKFASGEQDYVIHLTAKRKLMLQGKWVFTTELCKRRKGKVKLPLFYKGKT